MNNPKAQTWLHGHDFGILIRRCKLATSVIALFIVTACNTKTGSAPIQDLGTLKVGIDKFAGFAPVYLAQDIARETYHLDVKPIIIPSTDDRTSALKNGDIDVLCTTEDSLLLSAARGLDLVIVAAVDESAGADGIVVAPTIHDIRELTGKLVAFQNSMPSHFLLISALAKEGLPARSVYNVQMNAQEAGEAFEAGSVPAAVTWEPWLSRAAERGKGRLLLTSRDFPGLLVDVIAVRRDVFQQRRRAVLALYRGWMQAIEQWRADPEASEAFMRQHLELSPAEFKSNMASLHLADRQYNERFFMRRQPHSAWTLGEAAIRCWRDAGVLPYNTRPFSVESHVTDEIVSAAWPRTHK